VINPCGLHVVVGPTGSGKSMFMMQWIGRILKSTNRIIVTNLPLNWEGLADQMLEAYGWSGDLKTRIYHTDDLLALKNFWLCFGFGWTAIDVEDDAYELGYRPDYSKVYRYKEAAVPEDGSLPRVPLYRLRLPGVLRLVEKGEVETMEAENVPSTEILIDEAGSVFPQMAKKKLGRAYTHALEHKRKIRPDGLNVVCACQYANQLDSEIRNQANSWIYLANFAGRRKGIFYLPKKSVWQQFPTQPRDTDKPDLTGHFTISGGEWGRTYDTSAGVGLGGGMKADTGARPGGISWMWFPVFVAAFTVVAVLFMKQVPGGVSGLYRYIMGRGKPAPVQVQHVATNAPAINEVELTQRVMASVKAAQARELSESGHNVKVAISSFAKVGNEFRFVFFDGSSGSSADRRFGGIKRVGSRIAAVKWDGYEYEIRDFLAWKKEQHRGDHESTTGGQRFMVDSVKRTL